MIIIEFEQAGEDGSLENAQAVMDLLGHVVALEKAGTIKDVYMTTSEIEAELDEMDEAEQAALEPASA
jgi:hypothetical protein